MGDTQGVSERLCKPDHIYMDCMGFGMGCSCLQMTFQVKPLAIYIYGPFTLTEMDTNNMGSIPKWGQCWCQSLYSMGISA